MLTTILGALALDTDRDGIACENNPMPRDLVPVPRP